MDTILLTWRFQNFVTIAVMVAVLAMLATLAAQGMRRVKSEG